MMFVSANSHVSSFLVSGGKKLLYILIASLLLLTISTFVTAQPSFDNPVIIGMNEGLPSHYVSTITKDSLGFIWIGTDNGLCRWDGITTKVFQVNKTDSLSIAGNSIKPKSLIWDHEQNRLLIGTENGLSIYDPYTGVFKNYRINSNDPSAIQAPVTALIKDRQGLIWVGTEKGFNRFDHKTASMCHFLYGYDPEKETETNREEINIIIDIQQDLNNDSIFWIGTGSGLLKFNKYDGKFHRFTYLPASQNLAEKLNVFRTICPHPNGKLYLGTWTAGMVIFNTITDEFIKNFRPSGVPEDKVYFDGTLPPIKVKSKNEIWLPTVLGLSVFNTDKEKITFTKTIKNPAGKDYALWLNLIETNERIWCGSEYGVHLFDSRKQQFDNYFFDPSGDHKSYITWDIFEDKTSGCIYLAEQNADGLHYFNPEKQQFSYLALPVNAIDEISVNAILQTYDGKVWILCQRDIFQLSENREALIPVALKFNTNPLFTDIIQDKKGDIWISSRNYGLQKLDTVNYRLEEVTRWEKHLEPDRHVPDFKSILADSYNRIWFLRRGGGYGYYHPEKDTVCYFSIDEIPVGGFYNVSCLVNSKNDVMWVGDAENGLGYIDPQSPEKGIQPWYSKGNGLSGNYVHKIAIDNNNRLWMLTSAGLEMLDPETGETDLFTSHEGMITYDEFANRSSYFPGILKILSDGKMVIGYRRGLGFFHPEKLKPNHDVPSAYISSVKIFDQDLKTGEAPFFLKLIQLNHKQNFISFEYSAVFLRNNPLLKFFHQMEGVDREWVQSSRRFASYANLAPGEYTFKVKARNKQGLSDEHTARLRIIIHPPWWKTWWAYCLYLLIILVSILIVYRFQLNRQLIQREATRLRELNVIKSQLYSNITHEFRTPLTVIMGMADNLKTKLRPGDKARFEESLDMIKRSGGNLLHLVNQMLDLSKLESDKLELQPVLEDIIPYLQYITESFRSLAESRGIKLTFYNETEEVIMDFDQDKIFKIISNLLTNALKFTSRGGKVIFHVKKSKETTPAKLIIKIKDDGMGIPAEELPKIFDRFYQVDASSTRPGEGTGLGLALTSELINLMKGIIKVKSQPGQGSEFTVTLPISTIATRSDRDNGKQVAESDIYYLPDKEIVYVKGVGKHSDEYPFFSIDTPLTLIIEDNFDVTKYIASCLEPAYKVEHAKDGREGINKAIELIPDIIICDVMMPEKDGFEVCTFLKQDERTSHIPVILLTARAAKEDKLRGLTCGADAYLSKPFDKKELLVRIEKMIELRKHLVDKYSSRKNKLKSTLSPGNIEDVFLQKIISVIEQNIDDSHFGILQLSQNIGLSVSQLYRKLKALTGKSIAIFIRTVRLYKAKDLLVTTSLNVSEIAYETGFNDPAWFSRAFKEEFGESPNTIRKK